MWWLCVRFPSLILDSLGLRELAEPAIVTEQQKVIQANQAAAHHGIKSGQSIATALSLYPDIQALQRQPERELQLLEQTAVWAYRFSPAVSIDSELNSIHLELHGSLRLFKGFNRLFHYLSRGLEKRQLHYWCGLAHNPSAAYLMSYGENTPGYYRRSSATLDSQKIQSLLHTLPVSLLPVEKKIKQALHSMGIKQLKPLFELPVTSLGKRFGHNFCELMAYLKGEKEERKPLFVPPEFFSSSRYFAGGLDNKQHLQQPIHDLLNELKNYLRLRQLINRELCWRLQYFDDSYEPLTLQTSRQFFSQRSLFEITQLKLEPLKLKENIESLSLHCTQFEPIAGHSTALFFDDELGDNNSLSSHNNRQENYNLLMDKLLSRLQQQQCYQLSTHNHHLPELAWQATEHNTAKLNTQLQPTELSPRPLWLLEKPEIIRQYQQSFYWQGTLQLLQGPERIDNQWWQLHQSRDYYLAQHQNGGIYWVFKDRINQRWFVHGVFA